MSTRGVPVNGDVIRRLREEKGWTQEQLAAKTELSKKTIENAESGQRTTTVTLGTIAQGLGTDPRSLLKDIPQWIRAWLITSDAFIEDRAGGFVGREFVFKAIDRFLDDLGSGYFVIRGEPGIGKSAIVAQLVKTREFVHHFNIRLQGINTPQQFLENVCAQVIVRFNLSYSDVPQHAQGSGALLNKVLHEASHALVAGDKLVIAIDALDEVNHPSHAENVLYLPPSLPPCVFVVATTRHEVRLQVAQLRVLELDADSADNMQDTRAYLKGYLSDKRIQVWIKEQNLDRDEFVELLLRKSQGNFMYLHYVLPAIAEGEFKEGRPDELPEGLLEYYGGHWNKMRDHDPDVFDGLYKPVVCVLAAALETVSESHIAEWTGLDVSQVRQVLREWREFLYKERGQSDELMYGIYHPSFQEFLQAEVDLELATYHRLIADSIKRKIRKRKDRSSGKSGN